MDSLVNDLRRELQQHADGKTRDGTRRFFKEPVRSYGVKTAMVSSIAKRALPRLKGQQKKDVFALCENLWRSGYMEESWIACSFAYSLRKHYEPDDFKMFERWVTDYVSNWAACDTLCNHTIAAFIEKYPHFIEELKGWTGSTNRWQKRAAAVTLIIPARKGLFLDEIFAIADRLLSDSDDLVQKGYGWMLKAASEAHPQAVFDYLMGKRPTMPRTAFRYALEKMPAEWRARAMGKES